MTLNTEKLGKLLALASSDNDQEALSALRMAKNVLTGAGLDFKHVAERLATPKASTSDFPTAWADAARSWKPSPPPKPKGYTKGNFTWESKAAYDAHCAREAAQREAERQRYAPQRAAVLARYGSELAAIARDEREQALHDAAAPWLEGPFVPSRGYKHLAGRWHDSMGGWKQYDFNKHPPEACRAAIEGAFPMPTTIGEAMDEVQYWARRSDDLCHALESWGDEQLDLPASYRRELVQRLLETELPARDFTEVLARSSYYRDLRSHDGGIEAAIHRDLERLVAEQAERDAPAEPIQTEHRDSAPEPVQSEHPARASDRRAHVVALLSDPNTAALPDREIARRCGVSPSTVGALRRRVQTGQFQSEEGWQAAE